MVAIKKNLTRYRAFWAAIYVALLSILTFIVVAYELSVFDFKLPYGPIARILFFDRYIVESLGCILVLAVLLNGNLPLRILGYLVSSCYLLVTSIQIGSMVFGGEFFSVLALENLVHIDFFITPSSIFGVLALVILSCILPFHIERAKLSPLPLKVLIQFSAFLLSLGVLMNQSHRWISNAQLAERESLFLEKNMSHTSPMLSLYHTVYKKNVNASQDSFTTMELMELKNMGFIVDPKKNLPFVKDKIYNDPLPFEVGPLNEGQKPNVILMFVEGLSARAIHAYGGKYSDLTKNIDDYRSQAMMVTNYYNHTAASYRGMHGQLCSPHSCINFL